MAPVLVLLLAFLIGVIAGLRALVAAAVVAWAGHVAWLNLHNSPLSFISSAAALAIFTLLALGELIADKLPSTPSRTKPMSLIARILLGGLSGAAIAVAGMQPLALGAALGIVGALVGAFAGHVLRVGLGRALRVPDVFIGFAEDAVAVIGGLVIVSRF